MAIECYGWQVRTLISYYMGGFANTYYYYAWHIYIALAVPGVVYSTGSLQSSVSAA